MATGDLKKKVQPYKPKASAPKKKVQPYKAGTPVQKKLNSAAAKPKNSTAFPTKETPATRAKAKQFEAMAAAKVKAAATKKARNTLGAPAGRGASVAAAKKNTPGTVTRGKSNPVLDALRNAANSMTTNREKAINEKYWREGGNRPKAKPKGK